MAKLLYKDLRLSNLALVALMMSLCLLMLIPAYLLYVGLIYICLAVFFTQQRFREDNDIYFSMLLPIRKRDIVRGHVLTYSVFELAQLVVAVPVAIVRDVFIAPDNPVGIDANPALFGSALIMYALFNFVFLTGHYKTAHNLGIPLVLAGTVLFVYIAIAEVAVQFVPVLKSTLDVVGQHWAGQFGVLALGLAVFVLGNVATYRVSAARFERVDL